MARVRIHMLGDNPVRTYRDVDQIFRLPVVAFTIEKGVAFAFQDIQHRSPRCFLRAPLRPPAGISCSKTIMERMAVF